MLTTLHEAYYLGLTLQTYEEKSALRQMGRDSCSIQRTVTSVDAAADFRADFKSEVTSEPQLKEKAMKKTATNKPQDATRSKSAKTVDNKVWRAIVGDRKSVV